MNSNRLKSLFLGCLPVIAFIPLMIVSTWLLEKTNSSWVDWFVLLGSASLMLFNPILKSFESKLQKGIVFVFGFIIWAVLLFFSTFFVIWITTGDSL